LIFLFGIAVVCSTACSGTAPAQSGISNQRDRYGNLVRDGGITSPGAVNQGPTNNGAIRNGPAQPTTGNAGPVRGAR
jgi:hypothetical protein